MPRIIPKHYKKDQKETQWLQHNLLLVFSTVSLKKTRDLISLVVMQRMMTSLMLFTMQWRHILLETVKLEIKRWKNQNRSGTLQWLIVVKLQRKWVKFRTNLMKFRKGQTGTKFQRRSTKTTSSILIMRPDLCYIIGNLVNSFSLEWRQAGSRSISFLLNL